MAILGQGAALLFYKNIVPSSSVLPIYLSQLLSTGQNPAHKTQQFHGLGSYEIKGVVVLNQQKIYNKKLSSAVVVNVSLSLHMFYSVEAIKPIGIMAY